MSTYQFRYLDVLSEGYRVYAILVVAFVLLALWRHLAFSIDSAEPPFKNSKIPWVGHIIGILTHHAGYYNRLIAEKTSPIFTMRLWNARAYVITSPALIQSALGSKNLSFEPYMVELTQTMLGLSDEEVKPIKALETAELPKFMTHFINTIHTTMTPKNVGQMNQVALDGVASTLNSLGNTTELDSFYLWIRNFLTVVTCEALLGSHNPLNKDPSLVDAIWDFEGSIYGMTIGIFPSLFVYNGIKARKRLQKALGEYYAAEHDFGPDVAPMTKARAAVYRQHGVPPIEIGKIEVANLHVATTNSIPALFWNLAYIFADADVTATIQEELSTIIKDEKTQTESGRRVFSIDISKLETHCPVLCSSFRETLRLVNSHIGIREVAADTTITDGESTYLLKAGTDVIMPAGVSHILPAIWGSDATTFNARRFLPQTKKPTASERVNEKDKKGAYIPFGGGKHLCPGRKFAFAEIVGTVAIIILGFDVRGRDGTLLKVPEVGRARIGEGVVKPTGEGLKMGARLERRKGWEDVEWRFVVC